jgi:hypothetical protein
LFYHLPMRGKTPPLLHGPRRKLSRSKPATITNTSVLRIAGYDEAQLGYAGEVLRYLADDIRQGFCLPNNPARTKSVLLQLAERMPIAGNALRLAEDIQKDLEKVAQRETDEEFYRLSPSDQLFVIKELAIETKTIPDYQAARS